jgi:hypothetical protein
MGDLKNLDWLLEGFVKGACISAALRCIKAKKLFMIAALDC